MFIAEVTGSVVSTQKVPSLTGHKLLVVEPYRLDGETRDSLVTTGRTFIAIDALGGAPGIYSARWAGPDRDYDMAFSRIIKELGGDEAAMGARAAFVCVLVLILPCGEELVAEGRVEGRLTFPPRGEGGFGYDPIFIPDGEERTFGEMTPTEKAGYSHRAKALTALRAELGLL